MERFTVALAGVPVEIMCQFPTNRAFLKEYLTEQEPMITVCPSKKDLAMVQADFDRIDGVHHGYAEDFLENNAIHALIAEKLVEYGVLLMHGSALCMDGEAYIFTARSGTGKSTHARLWREVFGDRVWMINDDKPLLRIMDSGVTVYGTPWDGKHRLSRNACVPLKAIVKLERSEINRIEPLPRPEAFSELMRQTLASKQPDVMAQAVALKRRLLDSAAFYRLGCNMEPEAALIAWQGMNAGISR